MGCGGGDVGQDVGNSSNVSADSGGVMLVLVEVLW